MNSILESILVAQQQSFHPVVDFKPGIDKVAPLDISGSNKAFTHEIYNNPEKFQQYITDARKLADARYLIGGYRELRSMYSRSVLFNKDIKEENSEQDEPRSLHLGMDIWADAGVPIYAPLGGMIHSLAFNNNFGDYGATIILQHQLDTANFYTLYGHLSLKDLGEKRVGQFITRGEKFAHFGPWEENGNWPPHLHFQIIMDMGNWEGDYPGVCKMSEAIKYLQNSPDPDLIVQLKRFISIR